MVTIEEIFEKAKAMAGGSLSDSEGELLKDMCAAAKSELQGRLRDDVELEEIGEQFIRATATLALSLYIGLERGDGLESFSAGSVSVKKHGPSYIKESVDSLRKQAELMLAGFLHDEGFAFRTVTY